MQTTLPQPGKTRSPTPRRTAFGLTAIWLSLILLPMTGYTQDTEETSVPKPDNEIIMEFPTGDQPGQIGLSADVPNLVPQGPDAVAASPQGEVFILDSVNGRIVRALPPAEPLPSMAIAEARQATDLVVTEDFFYVLDSLGRQVLKYDAEGTLAATFPIEDPNIDLVGSVTLVVLPNDDIRIRQHGAQEIAIGEVQTRGDAADLATPTPRGSVNSRFVRTADTTAQVALSGAGRGEGAPATLEVDSQDFLASAELVTVDTEGRYYVLAEEMQMEAPEISVHTALARYSDAGQLQEVAHIPVEDVVFLPNRYVAVTPAGEAYFLQPLEREVLLVKLAFAPQDNISASGPAMTRGSRAAPPEVDDDFQTMVRGEYADSIPPTPRGRGISRDQILENARRYLTLDWTLKPANYSKSGIRSQCSPPGSKWRRPRYLEGRADQTIQSVPYKWGGYDSLSRFQDRIAQGYLAGDICTCRSNRYGYCITGNTTGVDCSGFVSRVLEENYHTTSRMHEITNPLSSIRDLRPGDILNRAGRHVRLFAGFSESGPLVLNTIESSVSCGGVCAASYKVSQLSRYKPLRYKYLGE